MKALGSFFISILFVTSLFAKTTTCDSLSADITSLQTTVTQQQKLVSKLSDDIGVMADRIGTMADRIVATENLLSQTLLALTGNKTLQNSVALLAPLDSSVASKTTPPSISLSNAATKYLLHVSKTATFERASSLVLYIDSDATLAKSWAQVSAFAATNSDVVFIAVQSIDNNVISTLSNGVKLTLQ